jgi:beta-ribofuranosylaminobenzene 5'-phosphate synthase
LRLRLKTPSRLHFGLIDLNGSLGRIDGGMGVALQSPGWEIEACANSAFEIKGESTELGRELLTRLRSQKEEISTAVSIAITKSIPQHVGLGSKTQLSLAIAAAVARFNGWEIDVQALARLMGRGGTSGVGVAAFSGGGCVLDGGHSFGRCGEKTGYLPSSASNAHPPPVLVQVPVPSEWRFVVALPRVRQGASGTTEMEIFQRNCPISDEETNLISRIILMKCLPSILEGNVHNFGQGLLSLTQLGFKRLEVDLQHRVVRELIELCMTNGGSGAGMSSFGPATFALAANDQKAEEVRQAWLKRLKSSVGGDVWITAPNNTGAEITQE